MTEKRLNDIETLTQLVDDQFLNEALELIAEIRTQQRMIEKLKAGVDAKLYMEDSRGCLFPRDWIKILEEVEVIRNEQ